MSHINEQLSCNLLYVSYSIVDISIDLFIDSLIYSYMSIAAEWVLNVFIRYPSAVDLLNQPSNTEEILSCSRCFLRFIIEIPIKLSATLWCYWAICSFTLIRIDSLDFVCYFSVVPLLSLFLFLYVSLSLSLSLCLLLLFDFLITERYFTEFHARNFRNKILSQRLFSQNENKYDYKVFIKIREQSALASRFTN